ncbi:MAG: AtpZ/AtpI family protein, partial [Alphaproteobacteria bacterium]|nr:AtpZ/AtpI family protein [Alphaproteobacteria bacterium]
LNRGFWGPFLAFGKVMKMAHPSDKNSPETDNSKLGDISSRLDELSHRLEAEKKEHTAAEAPSRNYGAAQDYSMGYRLLSEFVAGILVGAAVGYGLDRLFNTLPLFMIIFLLAGFAAGMLNMARSAKKIPPAGARLEKNNQPMAVDDDDEDDK